MESTDTDLENSDCDMECSGYVNLDNSDSDDSASTNVSDLGWFMYISEGF